MTNTAQKIISSGFDIALLDAPVEKLFKTFTVPVLFNDDGSMRAGFEIVGKNSDQYRDVIRATSVGAIQRAQQTQKTIDGKTEEGAGTLYDLGEDRNQKIAMAVVVNAPGFVSGGEPVPVTGQFLKNCFTKFPTWQEDILHALNADANFLAV